LLCGRWVVNHADCVLKHCLLSYIHLYIYSLTSLLKYVIGTNISMCCCFSPMIL
jgi:hypothetical protein